jgi:hypothetical protein
MIKFFRKIRQNMIKENPTSAKATVGKRTSKYLLYAIGEIVLVVIGILIALSINDWSEKQKNKIAEKRHLYNLLQDLKTDSIRLNSLEKNFIVAANSKRSIEDYLDGNKSSLNSLTQHFKNQWNFINGFVPNTTTINELKNSSSLSLISNVLLRRKIVTLYNEYEQLIIKLELGQQKSQEIIDYISHHTKNIHRPSESEIATLIEISYFINKIRVNYLYTQQNAIINALKTCKETIKMINKELEND